MQERSHGCPRGRLSEGKRRVSLPLKSPFGESPNSAGSSSHWLYSLTMMSMARGGFSRHLGSIVTLDRFMFMSATVGRLVVSCRELMSTRHVTEVLRF